MKNKYQILLIFCSIVFSVLKVQSQTWSLIGFGGVPGPNINDLAIDSTSGIIYVGGQFQATGTISPNIARRIGNQWDSLGMGTNDFILSLTMFNGELYAGGYFTTAGNTPANYIARWNGTEWFPLGTGMDGAVFELMEYNGELYAGGNFTTAGGVTVNHIAKWDGSVWSAVGNGCDAMVLSLYEFNGLLYAGGFFNNAGSVTTNGVASWDGTTWSGLSSGVSGQVRSFSAYNGELYMAGNFSQAGGISANNIVKWNGSGFESLGSGTNGIIYSIESYSCELYVAGTFTEVDGVPASELAKYNSIGGWSPSILPSTVNLIASIDVMKSYNNELYAAGSIYVANGCVTTLSSPVPTSQVTASFTASETIIQYESKIQFTNTSSNAVNYKWSFPGGIPTFSFISNPIIQYPVVGDYDVQLVVSNCISSDTIIFPNMIHVDSLAHPFPQGISSDFLTISTPPNTYIYEGDYHIYYYKPVNYDSLNSPLLIYIHGSGTTGASLTDLQDIADRQNALIVAPTMHNGIFGWSYVSELLQDTVTGCNKLFWMPQVLKDIYRHVLYREQRVDINTYLTGFSAGGQFTSRYMLFRQFSPDSIPIKMAVSVSGANYTLMTDTFNLAQMAFQPYRCGLAGTQAFVWNCIPEVTIPVDSFICNEHIIQYYNENYSVLVGTLDTSPFTGFCPGAQGTDRYDRAKKFYEFSEMDAFDRGTTLQWGFDTVVNVGHSGWLMYNSKLNATDTISIAEKMLFYTPHHTVPQLIPLCITTGISEDEQDNNKITLHPNPSGGSFTMNLQLPAQPGKIEIFNVLGALVYAQEFFEIATSFEITLPGEIDAGLYFCKINSDELSAVAKIVIEK